MVLLQLLHLSRISSALFSKALPYIPPRTAGEHPENMCCAFQNSKTCGAQATGNTASQSWTLPQRWPALPLLLAKFNTRSVITLSIPMTFYCSLLPAYKVGILVLSIATVMQMAFWIRSLSNQESVERGLSNCTSCNNLEAAHEWASSSLQDPYFTKKSILSNFTDNKV